MTAVPPPEPGARTPRPVTLPALPDLPAPSDRGGTRVETVVFEKIASQAATDVVEVGRTSRRFLGVTRGTDHDRPQATVHKDGRLARVSLTMAVEYPAPLLRVTRDVRVRVIERLAALAAIEVREVDIEVAQLRTEREPVARVR